MAGNTDHVTLTEENFASEVLESSKPTLVDFWAKWCGPCRAFAPVIEELARQFKGKATVGKVDIDEHPDLAARYAVRAIPSLLFFRDGEVVDRVTGRVPAPVLAQKLDALLQ